MPIKEVFYGGEDKTMIEEYTLGPLIEIMKINQVARAEFGINEKWFITKTEAQQFRYSDENGDNICGLVPLTYSENRARWYIIK